ncbi:ABC transporter substrate-binding protein (plasmid) [Paroceanicella profunda]|uniref:ABC transporter substrate-binding protein n=1 Tax=Paroceanicella profunda TaxID=2579971 RepID=A0A5B8FJ46_9RHOB|nr:ABC transporter substrate-binding protein [Paroceanicella profunda]QDL94027.1 ABC transporter substrate-binding protein [Paroceanicella profunda]
MKTSLRAALMLTALGAALPAFAADPVKIGLITTLSGPAGYLGADIRDGFELAMKDGTLGGVPVELMVEDDALKPGQGRQIAERFMTNEGVKLFTGIVFSNVAGATVPDIVDNGGFYVSANAAPSNMAGEECHENYFAIAWQNDSLHESGGLVANDLGYKNAFILAPNYQAGKDALTGFKRTFKGEIAGEIYTRLDQTDFAAEMAQIRAANPEMVYQFHPGGLGIAFMRQYQQAGLLGTIPMVVAEPSLDAVILKAVGDAALGINVGSHWNADFDNAANKTFVAAWKQAYGDDRPITTYAEQGYEVGLLYASALEATGGDIEDADAFREALRAADFASPRGNFSFGPNQHPVEDWFALEVVAGPDGAPMLKTKGKVVENYGDSYAEDCKM